MATFMERLAFLQKVPTLMKATTDDENPCPGYLFQEIGKISHESSGCGQCLLEYLLERLQVESCHVKLKVLKIFVHLCGHGSNHFLTELRRNSTFIQQASVYSGPPDAVHGTALYQKVRNTAQEVARLLFTDTISTKTSLSPGAPGTQTMVSVHRSGMQGFGYSPGKQGTSSDTLLDKIQKAAEVVASAVLPPTEHQGIRLHDNHYRAVVAPSTPIEVAVPACAYNLPTRRAKVTQRCPGQVGGGWEEIDSNNCSSHNSSQDIAANSRASGGRSSKSGGTGSQSGASRESTGDLSERVEAMQLGDCGQEMALISRLTEGSRVFLSREESQHFIKECSTLNCEVVVELLSRRLQDPTNTVQMRALCAVACLMTSDLLSLEQIFGATQRRLAHLSQGTPGPVANKATKILRQFEALMGGLTRCPRPDTAASSHLASADQPSAPTYPVPLLPTQSAEIDNFNCLQEKGHQSDLSSGDVPLPLSPPSPLSSLDPDQRGLSEVLVNDDDLEKMSLNHNEESVESHVNVRTSEAEVKFVVRDPELSTERGSLSPLEPQCEQPCLGRLSLFSGMELVMRSKSLRHGSPTETEHLQTATDLTEEKMSDVSENSAADNPDSSLNSPLPCVSEPCDVTPLMCDVTPDSSQPVSAFSFLNC
ncbi:AP-4 complex accessory subunit Tepsin isoform 2-T2 [Polymixia lowei]